MAKLQGKSIVIIGGTTGLGYAAAEACLAEGANVTVTGRNRESAATAQKNLGPRAKVLISDASNPNSAAEAIAAAEASFGGFHGLYHVAGGSGRRLGDGPLHEITDDGWTQTLHLNLDSVFYSNRAAVQAFLRLQQPGSILNMGSVLAWSPSPTFFCTHAYAAAKAAILGLSKSVAAKYATHAIRVNVLAPALVETPMSQRAASDATIQKFIRTKQPLDGGRIGTPADLNAAVVFFLSDDSRFTTGQCLAIDGGWAVTEGQEPQT